MILVTGGSGLVGSHLIKQLVANGHTIKALYHSTEPSFTHQNVQWVKGNILDVVSLEETMKNITHVYHCAAAVSFNPKNKKQLYQTNVEGTTNIVNACIDANVKKLVYVSSVAALGRIREDVMITEEMKWSATTSNSEYGKTKYLAEMQVWRGISEGLNAVIINPTIILGAGDWSKGSSEIFQSAYNEFPWFTNGISGFVDVKDVVHAMIALMESDIVEQRFIVSGHNVSYKKIFTLIAEGFNKKPPHKKVTPLIAAIVWRLEAIKGKLMGKEPLLTKETAKTAQAKVNFDNSKLLKALPTFQYTALNETIQRVCKELKQKYNL
ncbi:MAG: NAD-dependent epimerase/dehydratase family protein [Bacteroidetes bacterium]|nr:NAD-dependent epimerase/dehydratase family protein [Bacteroidota bacterium]MBS1649404.1 NAD-dependent epimerase/dehydratase family protein [Bacteroidota bacterium]